MSDGNREERGYIDPHSDCNTTMTVVWDLSLDDPRDDAVLTCPGCGRDLTPLLNDVAKSKDGYPVKTKP